jgi:hypothetical protein
MQNMPNSQPAPQVLPPVTSPGEARKLAEGLVGAMNDLLEVIDQETTFVREGKVREAVALDQRKTEASHQYVRALTDIQRSGTYMKRNTPELLRALHQRHGTFRSMLQVNLTVLATAHAVTEGIIRGVNTEVQRRKMSHGYTSNGQRAAPHPRHAAPVSINRSL